MTENNFQATVYKHPDYNDVSHYLQISAISKSVGSYY